MSGLSRRQFVQGAGVLGAGLVVGCGRLPRQPPPAAKMPRIGVLYAATEANSDQAGFLGTLRDMGHVDGQTIVIEIRAASGRADLLAAYADELVRLPVE